ncbi:MAG: nitroreductase family protein [Candidatus Hermodarchaeia archaeon]|jgi:ferredoxin
MSLFTVDDKKCNRGGVCVENCPAQIIVLDEDNQVPVPSKGAEEICINCGHCVSVCPTGALSLSTMSPEDCQPIQRELLPRPEQVEHLLRSRRSIRTYTDQMVDRKLLTHLLHVASYAPTGGNRQPVQWHIIYDPDDVQHLASLVIDWMRSTMQKRSSSNRLVADWDSGIDRICRNAPHVVVAHAPKDRGSASSSCLGACWAGYLNAAANLWPPMMKALGLPDGHACFGAMMIGYPKYRYQRIPLRNPAKISWL